MKAHRNVGAQQEQGKRHTQWGSLLYSVKLTIPLLILVAALSVLGTFIPQNASEHEYLHRYSAETYYLLKALGLLDMYHSWWFIGAVCLLAANITACSLKRLPSAWRQAMKSKRGYAMMGTTVTHLSVLLILVGGVIGARWGYKGYMQIPEGATEDGIYLNNPQEERRPLGFQVRCDEFRIEFYPDGSPREYISTLTFIEDDEVRMDHVPLRVNHPLSYQGLNFYQASYGTTSRALLEIRKKASKGNSITITIKLGQGELSPIPGTQAQIVFMKYEPSVHDLGEAILVGIFTPSTKPESFWLYRRSGVEKQQVGDFTFIVRDLEKRAYTGIQVSHDPGVPVVWVGCTLLVLGMALTFILRKPRKG